MSNGVNEVGSVTDPNKLGKVKLLIMDVDGTLTDGSMVFFDKGQVKLFHVHDGLGIRLAMNFGLDVALVTGNVSESVSRRAASLGIEKVYQGVRHKSQLIRQIAQESGLSLDEVAFIGDDLNDLPAFDQVGVKIAVADSADELRARADLVTRQRGGRGAVREAIEAILKARGRWEDAVRSFLEKLEREENLKCGPEAVA